MLKLPLQVRDGDLTAGPPAGREKGAAGAGDDTGMADPGKVKSRQVIKNPDGTSTEIVEVGP